MLRPYIIIMNLMFYIILIYFNYFSQTNFEFVICDFFIIKIIIKLIITKFYHKICY